MAEEKSTDPRKIGDILIGQSIEFEVGGRTLILRPRTLSQLLVISKEIVKYSDNLFLGIKNLEVAKEADEQSALDKFLELPYEHIIKLLQMFLDGGRVFNSKNPEVDESFLMNQLNFLEVTAIAEAALAMHNIGDVIKNLNGLRIN